MLRITAVSAGAVDYLIRGSGCCSQHERARDAGPEREQAHEHGPEQALEPGAGGGERKREGDAARYFSSAVVSGEAPGRWGGRGLELLGVQAGSVASDDVVRAVFGKLQDPTTGKSLGQAPRKYKNTEERVAAAVAAGGPDATPEQLRDAELAAASDGRKAVAYYDFTFSPSKTVSVYYAALLAAGQMEAAAEVAAAHERAVEVAMAYADEHVAYTRTGYHGRTQDGRSVGRYAAGEGLVWTAWKHSTNRESEPQLHTHVAVLNRLRTIVDGKIRALDGRGIRPVKEAIATAYERALEEELVAARGVVFADRPDGKAREIVGVDPELCAEASTRRAQTLDRAEELTALYVARNGREPDAAARKKILHDAAMATRKAKEGVAGPAAVAAWGQSRAARLVATVEAVADAAEAAASAGHPDRLTGHRLDPTVPEQRSVLLRMAIEDVQHEYATWSVGNLVAAIDRRVGALPAEVTGQARPAYLEALAREAVEPGNGHGVVLLTAPDPVPVPDELRRPQDGRSIFRPHIDERYATAAQLATEERIVAGARQLTAPAIAGPELELLRVELAAAGLGPDQVDAVTGIVSSGRAGDVLIGPAGTGKSYTVSELAAAWSERVGGRVLGLATTEIATQNLAADGVPAMNTAQFLAAFGEGPNGVPPRQRVAPGDLVVIDESGMSSTSGLDRIERIVAAGGGKLLYTGDQQQLTSVGAGGMLALLVADNGAFELEQVHRFKNEWEKQASLRVREGDASVIPEYEDRGRLHDGDREQMQSAAVRGYLADMVEGKEALLIVGSNEDAAALSREIRDQLIDYGLVDEAAIARLGQRAGGAQVSVGDRVQARTVDRSIRVDGGMHVANRAVYTVLGRDADGALRVRGDDGGIAHLPASYVDRHLTLAYASTVYAAQGRTVDTCHALLDEAAAREAAYVALSRGREANFAYLVAQRDPDEHQAERLESTAAGRMASVLGNVEAENAAEVERRIGEREGASLAWIGIQWDETSKDSARARYTQQLTQVLSEEAVEQLTAEPGWPRLVRAVREAELAGHNSEAVLAAAVEGRSLADANQVSDVLRWRVRVLAGDRTPEQQVERGHWTALAPPVDGPVGQFSHELAVLAEDRQHDLGPALLAEPSAWALEQLGPIPSYDDLMAQVDAGVPVEADAVDAVAAARAEWALRAGAVAAYRELRGIAEDATSIGAAPSREEEFHRQMWMWAAAALGESVDEGAVDYRTMPDLDLYATRERWQREQAFAPAYVAEEMREAYQLGREYTEDAALAGARLATLEPDDPEWEATAAQLERSERLASLQLERARQLDEIHHVRGGWYGDAEDARVAAELAAAELGRRGLSLERDRGEQLALFDLDPSPTGDEPAPDVEAEQAVEVEAAPAAEPEQERMVAPDLDDAQLEQDPEPAGAEVEQQSSRWARLRARLPSSWRREAAQPEQVREQEPTAPAEAVQREEQPEKEEQLALFDLEPAVADVVGAQPLRPVDDPAQPVTPDAGVDPEQLQLEQVRVTVAEARRQAAAVEAQRRAREAAAAAETAVDRQPREDPAAVAEADRARRDDAEREAQIAADRTRDRAPEHTAAAEVDEGPSIEF